MLYLAQNEIDQWRARHWCLSAIRLAFARYMCAVSTEGTGLIWMFFTSTFKVTAIQICSSNVQQWSYCKVAVGPDSASVWSIPLLWGGSCMHLIVVKTDLTQVAHSHVSSGLSFVLKNAGSECHFKFRTLIAYYLKLFAPHSNLPFICSVHIFLLIILWHRVLRRNVQKNVKLHPTQLFPT